MLIVTTSHIKNNLDKIFFSHNLKVCQAMILRFVSHHKSVNQNAIARSLHLKKSTISEHIDNLVELGYIYKETSTNDKREKLIKISEEGEKINKIIETEFDEYNHKIKDKLGKDNYDFLVKTLESFIASEKSNMCNCLGKEEK